MVQIRKPLRKPPDKEAIRYAPVPTFATDDDPIAPWHHANRHGFTLSASKCTSTTRYAPLPWASIDLVQLASHQLCFLATVCKASSGGRRLGAEDACSQCTAESRGCKTTKLSELYAATYLQKYSVRPFQMHIESNN